MCRHFRIDCFKIKLREDWLLADSAWSDHEPIDEDEEEFRERQEGGPIIIPLEDPLEIATST